MPLCQGTRHFLQPIGDLNKSTNLRALFFCHMDMLNIFVHLMTKLRKIFAPLDFWFLDMTTLAMDAPQANGFKFNPWMITFNL